MSNVDAVESVFRCCRKISKPGKFLGLRLPRIECAVYHDDFLEICTLLWLDGREQKSIARKYFVLGKRTCIA